MEPVELQLTYGNAVRRTVRFEGGVRLADDASGLVGDQSLTALEAAVHQALSQPIEFPSVEQAIVRVIAWCWLSMRPFHELPTLFAQSSSTFSRRVWPPSNSQSCWRDMPNWMCLSCRVVCQVKLVLSCMTRTKTKVAYVAANKQGEPIYMNRTLVDADVVIPIMCARGRLAIDYEGAYGVFRC